MVFSNLGARVAYTGDCPKQGLNIVLKWLISAAIWNFLAKFVEKNDGLNDKKCRWYQNDQEALQCGDN